MLADTSLKRRKGRKYRFPQPLPAPRFSTCVYVRLAPHDVAMFRFLLEAEDNLAYMSTVDRWKCVLRLTCSPHQRDALYRALASMRATLPFDILPVADAQDTFPPRQ